jgi:prevent-host-death family protein
MEREKMETVGVRELKANLSRYLKKVKSGEKIIVTDRKEKVAVISPLGKETDEDKLLALIQRGAVYWSGGKPLGIPSRISSRGKKVSDAILEERR